MVDWWIGDWSIGDCSIGSEGGATLTLGYRGGTPTEIFLNDGLPRASRLRDEGRLVIVSANDLDITVLIRAANPNMYEGLGVRTVVVVSEDVFTPISVSYIGQQAGYSL